MTTASRAGHLSQLTLDLLLLGELSDSDTQGARKHLKDCAECRLEFEAMEGAAQLFDREVRARTQPTTLPQTRLPEPRTLDRRVVWGLAGALAACVAFLTFSLRSHVGAGPSDVTLKGPPQFTVFVKHDGQVSEVVDGQRLHPHDAIRFVADPGGYPFLLVASIDGGGRVTVYLPFQGERSAPIDPHRRFEAPSAISLDETLGPERIFALFSFRALEANDVVVALSRIGREPDEIRQTRGLPIAEVFQVSRLIEK